MNPLIFLDIDGVLNSQLYLVSTRAERIGKSERSINDDLDPQAVTRLNDLCASTGAKVVITSTWRLNRAVDELQSILESRGFTGEAIDKTEDLRRGEAADCILRGNEILHWIKGHPELCGAPYWDYKRYVILDDDSDFLYWQRDNLIITDPYCGLTPRDVFKARRVLGAGVSELKAP
jgi:hypothetical protein